MKQSRLLAKYAKCAKCALADWPSLAGVAPTRTHATPLPSLLRSKMLIAIALLAGLEACAVKRQEYDVPQINLPAQFGNINKTNSAIKYEDHNQPVGERLAKTQNIAIDVGGNPNLLANANPHPNNSTSAGARMSKVSAIHELLTPQLEQWWLHLGSAELNQLIELALANNSDLKIANLHVAQARLRSEQTSSARLPEISLPLESKIESPFDGLGTVRPGDKIKTRRTYQASVRADWPLDLWGEKQAEFESEQLQWWRAIFVRDDTRRNLIASLCVSYIELLALNDRIRVAQETSTALANMLATIQQRYDRHDATITELEQQRAAVFAVRATLPGLEQQRSDVINTLHFLLGVQQSKLVASNHGLATLQLPVIEPGVPSNLLLRRPDVRVMEARLLAADADIDVARARILPSLNLTAQYGMGSHVLSELFAPQSRLWEVVAGLSANIFDGGKRRAEVEYARSVHQEMTESYMRVVYVAIREVNAALSGIHSSEQRQSLQQEAVDASLRAWQHGKQAWNAGAMENTALLESERSYQRNLDELLRIKQERFRGVVNLYMALGGGVTPAPAIPGKGLRPQEGELKVVQASDSVSENHVLANTLRTPPINTLTEANLSNSSALPHMQNAGNGTFNRAHFVSASANADIAPQSASVTTNASAPQFTNTIDAIAKLIPPAPDDKATLAAAAEADNEGNANNTDSTENAAGLPIAQGKTDSYEALWVAEIMHISQREQIAQEWRKLREHYPDWMMDRFVVARAVTTPTLATPALASATPKPSANQFSTLASNKLNKAKTAFSTAAKGVATKPNSGNAAIASYALYVGNFLSIEQGEALCEVVRKEYPGCQVLPSEAIGGRSTSLRMTMQLTPPDAPEANSVETIPHVVSPTISPTISPKQLEPISNLAPRLLRSVPSAQSPHSAPSVPSAPPQVHERGTHATP